MPRVVDHELRRGEIAGALWQVVHEQGIHLVSVRTVAARAGTSPSALRHYFSTQDELLAFALRSVVERVTARLVTMLPGLQGRSGAQLVLEQLLPLDADRRDETQVYLAFVVRAHLDPALRAIRDEAEAGSRRAVRHALGLLAEDGALAGCDLEVLTDRTYPLVDGLALHGTLWPDRYPPEHLRRALSGHLDALF